MCIRDRIRILKRLFRLMSQYKGRLYLGIALSMISNILGIVPIICGVWTIKLILDDSNGAAVLEPVYVLQLTTIILGSVLLRWLFAYIRATRQDSIAHEVTCAERLKIGDILKRVSLGFLQRKNMGEFTTAITTDLAFFEMQTMNVVNMAAMLFSFFGGRRAIGCGNFYSRAATYRAPKP